MRSLVFLLAGLLATAGWMHGEIKTPENAPIEITSTGQTTYENGLATARDNVAIHIGNTDIYADYAQYNSSTHDVELRGHVRIYRDASLYNADSGIYNTETKKIRAITGRTESQPYFLAGNDVTSIEGGQCLSYQGRHFHDARFVEARFSPARPQDSCLRERSRNLSERHRLRREGAGVLVSVSLPIARQRV